MAWLYGFDDNQLEVFPCTILELRAKGTVEMTEKPIEGGSTITDHAVIKPAQVTAKIFVSPVDMGRGTHTTVKEAVDLMERIRVARQVNTLSLQGDIGPFEEMILTSYDTPRDSASGNGSEIDLEFTRVQYATAEVSAVLPRRSRNRRRVVRGPQATRDTPRASLAASIFEDVTGMGLIHTPNR